MLDSYGRPFSFMLPNGQKRYKSLIGTILTVIAVTLVGFYAIYKWQLLLSHEDTNLQVNIVEEASIDAFGRENGLNFAVGIGYRSPDNTVELDTVDESYGRMRVKQKQNKKIMYYEMSPCKEAEIAPKSVITKGISAPEETKSLVYPTTLQKIDLNKDVGSMLCVADDDKKLFIQSFTGQTRKDDSFLSIYFEPCQNQLDEFGRVEPGTTVCKSAEALDEWLERQSIYIFLNE